MRYRSMLFPATATNVLPALKLLPVFSLFLLPFSGFAAAPEPDSASLRTIIDSTTQASNRPRVVELEQSIQAALRKAIQGDAPKLTRSQLEQANNTIHLVPDTAVIGDNKPYTASGGAFPSGHTNTGYTDALLLAEMIPERFVPLINRGARYGYSRIVLGVHYPLDVIGSRMIAERNVAHYLNDPQYRRLFEQAKTALRSALEKACGTTLSACAQNAPQDDPYAAPEMKTFYRYTMTYGLPAQPGAASPVSVPEGAEVLLDPVLPHLSVTERRSLMVKTALADGYPLSGAPGDKGPQNFWQRLNLHDAVQLAQHQ
ncbi:acid phosphatase [Pectobacterium versatile]|uniref:Phosphatase PAP2 family protein n=1 Tax=Pectobacterium versatile TaxID=2488639 RepID=A0AAW3RRP4_9GAMM|nr:phosphatase PAP2 family protein [Pectobacterium versatile]MBA0158819.1 phosphatase PAP2 family protein [Pectobacterium versatile]